MTSHSEYQGFIRGLAENLVRADGWADAGACRDGIVNNLAHLLDEAPQHLGNMILEAGAFWQQSSPSTTRFLRIDDLPPYTFPLRIDPTSGNSKRVVPYVRAYISSAGTATFRAQLTISRVDAAEPIYTAESVAEATTTSTSTAGVDLVFSPTVLYIPAAIIGEHRERDGRLPVPLRGRPRSLRGDGSLGVGEFLDAQLTLWAKTSQGGALPTVLAFSWREYTGE